MFKILEHLLYVAKLAGLRVLLVRFSYDKHVAHTFKK